MAFCACSLLLLKVTEAEDLLLHRGEWCSLEVSVTPGDDLIMEMNLIDFDDRLGFAKLTGKAYVGGRIAVSVEEFTFALAR